MDVDESGDASVDALVEGPVTVLLDKPVVATLSTAVRFRKRDSTTVVDFVGEEAVVNNGQ